MLHGEVLYDNLHLNCKQYFGGGVDFTNQAANFYIHHCIGSTIYVLKLITIY